jgi:hypothetical protein
MRKIRTRVYIWRTSTRSCSQYMWEGTNGRAVYSTRYNYCISRSYYSFYNNCFDMITLSSISLICDHSVTTQNLCFFIQEKLLKFLKCYNFLWVQRRHNCSPAASFAKWVMTLYLTKVHPQTFVSIPLTQKFQILSCDTQVVKGRFVKQRPLSEVISSLRYISTWWWSVQ